MKTLHKYLNLLVAALLTMTVMQAEADNPPLCFTARNGSVTVTFTLGITNPAEIEYSTDSSI